MSTEAEELDCSCLETLEVWETEELDAEPPLPGFADVEGALETLRTAVQAVADSDAVMLSDILAELRAAFPAIVTGVLDGIGDAPLQTKESLLAAFDAVAEFVTTVLEPHREVPERLEESALEIRDRAKALKERATQVGGLAERPEWTGQAAEGYRRVTEVQAKALEELAGAHEAYATALERAAMLNRAAFFYCSEALHFTADQIQQVSSGSTLELFAGSKRVESELKILSEKLRTEVGNIAEGDAAVCLAQELEQVLNSPQVLQPGGWPVGPNLADVEPADLATLVTPADEPAMVSHFDTSAAGDNAPASV